MSDDGTTIIDVSAPPFTCPACGETAPYGDPTKDVVKCSACESAIAYGVAMPRVFVIPCDNRRFVLMRFETWDRDKAEWVKAYDVQLATKYGVTIWENVRSVAK